MGDFLLGIQREKMAFGSVFFVSRAVVRGSEILRRVPQQIWCQKNATFSSCPSWYIYTQSLTPGEPARSQGTVYGRAAPRLCASQAGTALAAGAWSKGSVYWCPSRWLTRPDQPGRAPWEGAWHSNR